MDTTNGPDGYAIGIADSEVCSCNDLQSINDYKNMITKNKKKKSLECYFLPRAILAHEMSPCLSMKYKNPACFLMPTFSTT